MADFKEALGKPTKSYLIWPANKDEFPASWIKTYTVY